MKKILIMMFLSLMSMNVLGVEYNDPYKRQGFSFNTPSDFAKYYTKVKRTSNETERKKEFVAESDGNDGIETPVNENKFTVEVMEDSSNKFYLNEQTPYTRMTTPVVNVDKANRIQNIISIIDCDLEELDLLIEIEAKKTLLMYENYTASETGDCTCSDCRENTCDPDLNKYINNFGKIKALKQEIYTRITSPLEITILDWIMIQRLEASVWERLNIDEISQITDRGERVKRLKNDSEIVWETVKNSYFNPKTGWNDTYIDYQKRIDAASNAYLQKVVGNTPDNTVAITIESSNNNQEICNILCENECIFIENKGYSCECTAQEKGVDTNLDGLFEYCIPDPKCDSRCYATDGTCITVSETQGQCAYCPKNAYPKDVTGDGLADICQKYLNCPDPNKAIDTDQDGYADVCDDGCYYDSDECETECVNGRGCYTSCIVCYQLGCEEVYNEYGQHCNGGGDCIDKTCYCYPGYAKEKNTCVGDYLNLLGTSLTDERYEEGTDEGDGRYFATEIWPGVKGNEWIERYFVAKTAKLFFDKVRKGDVLNVRGKDEAWKYIVASIRGFYHHTTMATKDLKIVDGNIGDPFEKVFISARGDGVMYEKRRMYQYLLNERYQPTDGYFYTPEYYIITAQTPKETVFEWRTKWVRIDFGWAGSWKIPIPYPYIFAEKPSQKQRDKAVDYAKDQLDEPYNLSMYQYFEWTFYCTSIVWRSWDKVVDAWLWGFDIDSTLNPTVFPIATVEDWNMSSKRILIYPALLSKAFYECEWNGTQNPLCGVYYNNMSGILDAKPSQITYATYDPE